MDRHNNMFFLQNFNQEIIMSHLNDTFYQIFKYLEYDIENFFKIKGWRKLSTVLSTSDNSFLTYQHS